MGTDEYVGWSLSTLGMVSEWTETAETEFSLSVGISVSAPALTEGNLCNGGLLTL